MLIFVHNVKHTEKLFYLFITYFMKFSIIFSIFVYHFLNILTYLFGML